MGGAATRPSHWPIMRKMTALGMVAEAMARVEGLSPTEVAAALDSETLLVDVREPEERHEHGALSGSISTPRGELEFRADPESVHHRSEFVPTRRTILYCNDGARSALAANTLQDMGYWRVAYLRGGIEAWRKEGRLIEGARGRIP